jgi:hypothetical protein
MRAARIAGQIPAARLAVTEKTTAPSNILPT